VKLREVIESMQWASFICLCPLLAELTIRIRELEIADFRNAKHQNIWPDSFIGGKVKGSNIVHKMRQFYRFMCPLCRVDYLGEGVGNSTFYKGKKSKYLAR